MYLYLKSPTLRRLLTINKKLRISKSATYLIHCKLVIVPLYQHRACFRVKNTQSQESTIILSYYYSSYYYYYYEKGQTQPNF